MFEVTQLFEARTHGYHTYRIPALVATTRGTLLAFCAARHGKGGDWDPIDVVMRRSPDSGVTWEPQRVFATQGNHTVDNPVPIVDRETGAIHFLHQVDYARVYYLRSDDEGMSWSEARDITATIEEFRSDYAWRVVGPGPGHGIQLKSGRLVVPVWLSTGEGTEFGAGQLGHRPSCIATIYSDDHGATWRRGELVSCNSESVRNPNESVAVELSDGRVMLNIRNESAPNRRLISFSPDGATNWSEAQFHDELFEPICFASSVRLSSAPKSRNRILFANPDNREAGRPPGYRMGNWLRRNLTIRLSYDEGNTWPVSKVLDPDFAGYSDLAVGPDGTIYCLYEGGGIQGNMFDNSHMSIAHFDLDWLTDGRDSLKNLSDFQDGASERESTDASNQ
ncbi:MAG: sialidase family protein [Anaerolineae bacterium]